MEAAAINMGIVRGIATVFALLVFSAVVLWAWGKRSQDAFRSAAQLPLEEDDTPEARP